MATWSSLKGSPIIQQISDSITNADERLVEGIRSPIVESLFKLLKAETINLKPDTLHAYILSEGTKEWDVPQCIIDDFYDFDRAEQTYDRESVERLLIKAIIVEYELNFHFRTEVWT
ncbi:hypothetical protein nACB2_063 [Acinetobacter phage nACB2]|nr:hypothetical protein nACB2_063 [Acinetobacter phage nACB2]